MTVGFVGLGVMGRNMVLHLLEHGINVVVYNRTAAVSETFSTQITPLPKSTFPGNLTVAYDIPQLMAALPQLRTIFVMVKAGRAVDDVVEAMLMAGLSEGDTVIDGGNSFYKDTIRRYGKLKETGIRYVDCGTSGGLEGARHGASLTLGGDDGAVADLSWLWSVIAVPDGWAHVGPSGAGHFAKMVHNGIEYGIDQALGEGIGLLSKAPYKFDLAKVTDVWAHGSVIRSWLVELLHEELSSDPKLDAYRGVIGGGETGTWTLETASQFGASVPVIATSLEERKNSRSGPTFATKTVSALRHAYGGHAEPKE